MNGILLIDKPSDWTSFDVVAKLRGATHIKKIGHGGTLDPMATGVLPIFFGKATRVADILPDGTKRYEAVMELGLTTDTYDTTGEVLSRCDPQVTDAAIEAAAAQFRGSITQVPPMYSAVKVDGKRLYDLARKGKEVARPARPVEILELAVRREGNRVHLGILCSKGTYVRSICHDMGQMLGCGAAMCSLRRTASSGFAIGDCIPLTEAVERARRGELEGRLLPMSAAFASLPVLDVPQPLMRLMSNGVRIDAARLGAAFGATYRVSYEGQFMGIGSLGADGLFIYKNLSI